MEYILREIAWNFEKMPKSIETQDKQGGGGSVW